MFKILLPLLPGALAPLVLFGAEPIGQTENHHPLSSHSRVEAEIPVESYNEIFINDSRANLFITGNRSSESIKISGIFGGKNEGALRTRVVTTDAVQKILLEVDYSDQLTEPDAPPMGILRVDIPVRHLKRLKIRPTTGMVEVKNFPAMGVSGRVFEAEVQSLSSITMENLIDAALFLRSERGEIRVRNFSGLVEAIAEKGRIRISEASGAFVVSTGSQDREAFLAEHVSGDFDISDTEKYHLISTQAKSLVVSGKPRTSQKPSLSCRERLEAVRPKSD